MSDLKVCGQFLVLPTRQQAINLRHVTVLHITGREDPDNPRGLNVQLNADTEPEGGTASYVLGKFAKFSEAEAALDLLLAHIAIETERAS